MTLKEFKNSNKFKTKNTSELEKFKKEILELHNSNCSLQVIQDYLKSNKVTKAISIQNISKHIKKWKKEEIKEVIPNDVIEEIEEKKEQIKETTQSKKEETKKPKSLFKQSNFKEKNTELKKVDWV